MVTEKENCEGSCVALTMVLQQVAVLIICLRSALARRSALPNYRLSPLDGHERL